jgi:hypothetical protein
METTKYRNLSAWAIRLLLDVLKQSNGRNNGDFCCAWSVLQSKGWRSKGTLEAAKKELLECGFLVRTRQGGRNHPCLFGVSWLAIDECLDPRTKRHKLDHPPTQVPLGLWRD